MNLDDQGRSIVTRLFSLAQIPISSLDIRAYPDETIFIVRVATQHFDDALRVGASVDEEFTERALPAFVTVRPDEGAMRLAPARPAPKGVADERAAALANTLFARARTSEQQYALEYIPDATNNISTVLAPRHQLVFGRRGAGKTTLLLEAKRRASQQGHAVVWVNIHTHRHDGAPRAYLWVARYLLDELATRSRVAGDSSQTALRISQLSDELTRLSGASSATQADAARLVPVLRALIRRVTDSSDTKLFLFLDDFYYLPKSEQPTLLDFIHGSIRDCNAWIKVATIRHLTRWYDSDKSIGLQTSNDADHISLDMTLENPGTARSFLGQLLSTYARHEGILNLTSVLSTTALDRLVLASGAVPRDAMTLAARTIREARKRAKARVAGVQDVNRAAGEAAQVKITELEDDAAASTSTTAAILDALQKVRKFCLDDEGITIFGIDFLSKERFPSEYGLLQALMDLRMVHLINQGVSGRHESGQRSEVFMLDLSQFSDKRFKKNITVLDFSQGNLSLKRTGKGGATKVADTSLRLLNILRRAPLFDLALLHHQPGKSRGRGRTK